MKNIIRIVGRLKCFAVVLALCLICGAGSAFAVEINNNVSQQKKLIVTGTVIDQNTKEPLIGVNVKVSGTSIGSITDVNGKYSIAIPYSEATLAFSYIGYATKEVNVKDKKIVDVALMEDSKALEEVVVVGYTKQRKETMIGSVSTITTKDLKQSPTANINNALAGRLPGLIATQFGGGEPGVDKAEIYIRGKSTYGDQSPIVIIDGVERDLNYISAEEIESFTILKDAAATAAYGIRGANGVIVISTKRGSASEKASVSFKAAVGVNSPVSFPEYLGSADYATLYNEAKLNDAHRGNSNINDLVLFSGDAINKFRKAKGDNSDGNGYSYDYYNWLFKPGVQEDYSLSVRGGSSKARYYVLAGYFTQGGNYNYVSRKNQDFTRYNFRSNIDIDVTKRWWVRLDMAAQISDRTSMGSSAGKLMELASTRAPYLPIMVENNSDPDNRVYMNNHPNGLLYGDGTNRLNILGELIRRGKTNEKNTYLNGSFSMGWDLGWLVKGLKIEGTFSYDASEGAWRQNNLGTYNEGYATFPMYSTFYPSVGSTVYMDPGHYLGAYSLGDKYDLDQTIGNSFSHNASHARTYYQAKMDWAYTFDKVHEVSAMLLFNRSLEKNDNAIPHATEGLTGRLSYYYDKRYLAEFNFGYNGSENFAPGHRYGFFPALSVGWVVTNEKFMKNTQSWLDFLKLRASYGTVGSDYCAGQRFLYTTYYQGGDSYNFGSNLGSSYGGTKEGGLPNPKITWEKAKKLNIGLDIHVLRERLALTIDFFDEHRSDIVTQLVGKKLSYSEVVGADASYVNCGKVNNHGVDLELTWNDKIGRNFRYWIRPNFTYSRNKIIYSATLPVGYAYTREEGHRMGEHYDYVFDHFVRNQTEADRLNKIGYQSWGTMIPGDCVYKDLNRDGIIDDNDVTVVGNPQFPEIQFGIPMGFQYKNFDFSMLWQGSAICDQQLTSSAIYPFPLYDNDQFGKVKKIHLKRWTSETASTAKLPALHFGEDNINKRDNSSLYVYNASYLRLKTIEIGYRIPQRWLSKYKIEQIRFYAQGMNLLTFDKLKKVDIDPESGNGWGGQYPILKIFNFGVELTL